MRARFDDSKNDNAFEAAMALAKSLEAKKSGSKMEQKVKFAGQAYQVERAKTASDIKQE